MSKEIKKAVILYAVTSGLLLSGCSVTQTVGKIVNDSSSYFDAVEGYEQSGSQKEDEVHLKATDEINLRDIDGKGFKYLFTYNNEDFNVIYIPDHWKIIDSYKIIDAKDMAVICQALIDEHPVHGRDMVSFRTADDMVYEWQIHNMAYVLLPEDNPMKEKAKDVDLDPKDQGRTFSEIYKDRTGKDLDLKSLFGN
ncbi:hypothetical protein [Butyrivibrio sp. YAB3001]|uniref:hypothetical protein n=1 Tax=Butyrivibrio sp. YAB3001 TaxID=1520812 RepID=UPI0008F650FB|nr:hypothetical protein [Butyrivibrio sp. YAB3001]SFB88513.1 hypothetical protein SAMN02910398_01005 [Butyrivibrio sp. YAB3001]